MALNFLNLVNMVLDEIDADQLTSVTFSTSTEADVRRVKNYINLIYRQIFFERQDWSWARLFQTETTVPGTAAYTLDASTDYERIQAVYISAEPPMELLPYQEYIRKYQTYQSDATAKPFVATVFNGQLLLYPTPSDAYTVNVVGSKIFSELSAYDDTPYLPDSMRHVLFYGATFMAKAHDNEADSQLWNGLYVDALQKLRNSEGNNHKGYAMIPEEETVTAEYYETILLE